MNLIWLANTYQRLSKISHKKNAKKNSKPIAILKYGVIGELIDKTQNSCNVRFQNLKGWINKNDSWGC